LGERRNRMAGVHGRKLAIVGVVAGVAALALSVVASATGRTPEQAWQPRSRGEQFDPANRPDTYGKLPADKRAVLDRENKLRNQALSHPYSERTPGAKDTLDRLTLTSRLSSEVHPLAHGLLVDIGCDQMYPSADFSGTNQWGAPEDDHSVVVCAGALRSDAAQGVVLVSLWDQEGNQRLKSGRAGKFLTPRRDGPATIIAALGEVLTLQAKDGTLFYFDAGALKYVDGPPVEKATPVPGVTAP
jgi:hypothetical protein